MPNKSTPQIIKGPLSYKDEDAIDSLDMYGHTELYYAVESNNLKWLQSLLDSGANPNLAGEDTFPPLVWAAGHNYLACVEILLNDSRTDINARQMGNATALFMAVRYECEAMVDLLLAHNANPNVGIFPNNTSPLSRAIADGKKTSYGKSSLPYLKYLMINHPLLRKGFPHYL